MEHERISKVTQAPDDDVAGHELRLDTESVDEPEVEGHLRLNTDSVEEPEGDDTVGHLR